MSETFDDFTRNGLSEVVKIDRATLGQMSAELLTLRKQVSAKSDALASYADFYDRLAEILLGDKNPLPSTQTDNAMLEKVLILKQRVAKLEAEVASLQQPAALGWAEAAKANWRARINAAMRAMKQESEAGE